MLTSYSRDYQEYIDTKSDLMNMYGTLNQPCTQYTFQACTEYVHTLTK